MKTLIAGWFSFKEGHATAGDILARDLACQWIERIGWRYDVAVAPPFTGGVDWRSVDPRSYSHVLFVCGPFEKKPLESEFLKRFTKCRLIGLNLSMLKPLHAWNPFDLLFERDSSDNVAPDIVFNSRQALVPVVGVCLVENYEKALVDNANDSIRRLIASREIATVYIDTRLDMNSTHLHSPAEIESLIARMDMMVTTRLHGTILALKNGVPVIAIDPVAGGHKIKCQADLIGWPVVFTADSLTDHALQDAFDYCLTEEAREKTKECLDRAAAMVREVQDRFTTDLIDLVKLEKNYLNRTANEDNKDLDSCRCSAVDVTCNKDGHHKSGRFLKPMTEIYYMARRRILPSYIFQRSGVLSFGNLRRTTPVSHQFGYDRGRPIDRYYIESFLEGNAGDIRGHVLEIGDDAYTRKFGRENVIKRNVLNISADSPGSTVVGNLTQADHIPSESFDCIILTQTLHLIYDFRAALQTIRRILKPEGVVLATFPGISQISNDQWGSYWCWSFTALSAQRMFEEVFPEENIFVQTFGNVLTATAFLYGLAVQELQQDELEYNDTDYEVLITVKAVK